MPYPFINIMIAFVFIPFCVIGLVEAKSFGMAVFYSFGIGIHVACLVIVLSLYAWIKAH